MRAAGYKMDRTEAREEVLRQQPTFLQKAKKNGYICPRCKNGTGKDGTGITLYKNTNHYKCFTCGLYEDVVGLWKIDSGAEDDKAAFEGVYQYYGIEIDEPDQERHRRIAEGWIEHKRMKEQDERQHGGESNNNMDTQKDIHTNTDTQQEDLTAFFLQANKDLSKTDYYRGITFDTLNRYKVGYIEKWKVNDKAPYSPRLIIPTSRYSYIARDTRADLTDAERPYAKMKQGKVHIFNGKILQKADKPVYIVEGEIDALSIIDVGAHAVGLGSITMARRFIEMVEAERPKQPFIIALDNEDKKPVQDAIETLKTGLERLQIPYIEYSPYGTHKDANEALQADRAAFTAAVEEGCKKAMETVQIMDKEQEEEQARQKEEYMKNYAAARLRGFINGIADSVNTPCIPTGFEILDRTLDGGLYEGLYIIGALSSLGKTTLMMQIMDQIAKGGNDVLIFSLEMSANELMAKSISRETVDICIRDDIDTRNAKTARGITDGSRYAGYNNTEKKLIDDAINAYNEYADHICIIEAGMNGIDVNDVRDRVEKHILFTGKRPVVLIDYIQIMAPVNERGTDKQNMDITVTGLKQISRDFKIPVWGISALNRQSYNEPIQMDAYKESGAIEYSSDVLIGLQFKGVETEDGKRSNDFNVSEARMKDPREIQLKILKSRNGVTGNIIEYEYMCMFNRYEEIAEVKRNNQK